MRGEIYLVLTTLLAALGWGASKMVVAEMPGDLFIGSRFLIAGLLLLPSCYKQFNTLDRRQFAYLVSVGVILSIALQVWVYAVSRTSSLSEGAFIMSLAVILAPLTAWMLFRERPNKPYWIALPVAIVGMMLLTLTDGWTLEQSQLGFLAASVLLSAHFVLNKRLTASVPTLLSICIQLTVVGISGLLFAQFNAQLNAISGSENVSFALTQFELSNAVLFWFAISIVGATVLRYLVQTLGQSSVKIETASLIMILEPLWTLAISLSLLGEAFHLQKVVGGLVILSSLVLYRRRSAAQNKRVQNC
ncbi:DMT family transporter [Corallincola platygyrae]|uniref:DMT family transporter n=1 Tax=Corallincola platygyrae TaxID=1193278 RepID=A0ABW4XH97_9GAMM